MMLPSKSTGVVQPTKLYPLFAKHAGTSAPTRVTSKQQQKKAVREMSDSDDDDNDEDDVPLIALAKHPSEYSRTTGAAAAQKHMKRNRSSPETRPQNVEIKRPRSSNPRVSATPIERCLDTENQQRPTIASTQTPSTTSHETTNTSVAVAIGESCQTSEIESDETMAPVIDTESNDSENNNNSNPARVSLSPSKQRRQNRIYSDSVMDFVPPKQSSLPQRSSNVVTSLLQRSVNGKLMGIENRGATNRRKFLHQQHTNNPPNAFPSTKCPNWRWSSKWKIPSRVSLALGAVRSIDHVAWDEAGVLLAVATDKIISIFDFDMLTAADMQGRRDQARDCHDSQWNIPPIIQFFTPSPVSKLLWNHFHQDELVVGFRAGGKAQIYNVEKVAQWLSEDQANQRMLPPKKTRRMIDIARNDVSISDILFVDSENLLVSTSNSMVYRFKFMKHSSAIATLIWRYQAGSTVTTMARMGTNVGVLGTSKGQLCLLDWTKYSNARSFSNDQRPKILQCLVPHDGLAASREDLLLRKQMGILKLRVDATNATCEASRKFFGRCRITWVTNCGWVLSMTFDSTTLHDKCRVHHASARVVYRNAEGEVIDSARKNWSLPQSAVGTHMSKELVCLAEVPAVTNVLTHHDKFVLDGQPNMIRSRKRALVAYTTEGKQIIPLPKTLKQIPKMLEVHPSQEWIVLAEGKRLLLLSCRN